MVVREDVGFSVHAVRLGDRTDHTAGIPRRKRKRRNVARDHASCADHTAVADGDPGTDHDIGSEPAVVSNPDGFGIAEAFGTAVAVQHLFAFVRQHRMQRGDDGQVRPEVVVVADGDGRIILNGQIVIDKNSASRSLCGSRNGKTPVPAENFPSPNAASS